MRIFFLLFPAFICLITPSHLKAQEKDTLPVLNADVHSKTLLSKNYESLEQLAIELTTPFVTDSEKVRSIFIYVTHAINYDVNKPLNQTLLRTFTFQSAVSVLMKRKAVCEGYANLFKELCVVSGIKAEFIGGYARNEEESIAEPHAWNAAYINNEWKLFDPTWAAGGVNAQTKKFYQQFEEKYFMTPPQKLIQSHYPDDPMWQLLNLPVTRKQFDNKSTSSEINFSFNDTIGNHYKTDSIARMANELKRMIAFDPGNDTYSRQLNMFYENLEVDKMNRANDIAQEAIDSLNETSRFITSARQKRNYTAMNENEKLLFDKINGAEKKIKSALELLRQCSPSLPQNKMMVRNNISTLKQNLEAITNNKKYLFNYYNTPKANRARLL
ncbi:MAG TPA: transglutaminase domain-containing protein [Bacteroidia bacterium]|nr:transglutaminase domain-containing protein [Bacteroidia bacterium]HNU32309.1 transglutaminase domain-containing protein [Bacteroidia bacterium]